MTEGSIISIGVKWLMAPDCSQVSEKKSFSLGSSCVIPSTVIGTAGEPSKVNGDGALGAMGMRAGHRQGQSSALASLPWCQTHRGHLGKIGEEPYG